MSNTTSLKVEEKVDSLLDETILSPEMDIDDQHTFFEDSMKKVVNFMQSLGTVTIDTSFKGTCFQVTKDESQVLFTSRNGRVCVTDLKSLEIVADENPCETSIWAIALSSSNEYLYSGGQEKVILKLSIKDLSEVDRFIGHEGDINAIAVSLDDQFIFSASDDSTVRMWSTRQSAPRDVTLYNASGIVYAMDLSNDGKFICSGGEDNKLYVYELQYSLTAPGKLLTSINCGSVIWAVKISPSNSTVLSGDELGLIKVFDFFTWKLRFQVNHGERVRSIDVSVAEDFFVTCCSNNVKKSDHFIKIWDFKNENPEISLKRHGNWVKTVKIMRNQERVMSLSDDKKIMISKIPKFESKISFESDDLTIKSCWYSQANNAIEAVTAKNDTYCVTTWDAKGKKSELIKLNMQEPEISIVSHDHLDLIIFSLASDAEVEEHGGDPAEKYFLISIFDTSQGTRKYAHLINQTPYSAALSSDHKHCFIGEIYRISVWTYPEFQKVCVIFAHNCEIVNVITDITSKLLFSVGEDNVVKKFDISKFDVPIKESDLNYLGSGLGYTKTLEISKDNQYLYVVCGIFKVLDIKTFNVIMDYQEFTEYRGIFKNLNNSLFLVTDYGADIFSAKSFQILSRYRLIDKVDKFLISTDFKYIFHIEQNKIKKGVNPMSSKELSLVGDVSRTDEFITHVNSLIQKSDVNAYNEHWLIEPIHMNVVHLYAYFNQHEIISEAIRGTDSSPSLALFESRGFISPLTIALNLNLKECVHSIVTSIRKILILDESKNVYKKFLYQYLEDSLIQLNLFGYTRLHKLYNEIYEQDTTPYLPNFCDSKVKLPYVVKSDYFFPSLDEFKLSGETPDDGLAIVFEKSLLKFYLVMGSSKSIEFLRSLDECSNEKVFETKVIQIMLREKWKVAKWYIVGQIVMYIAYIILLCLYVSDPDCRNSTFLIAPFAVSSILYAYELIFVFMSIIDYFEDFWNIIDTLRSWLMMSYSILVWTGYFSVAVSDQTNERYFLAVVIFVSWMRGITYFRVNSSTRYLIKLLFQVCIDMIPFLIILLYSGVAFGLIFRAFNVSPSDDFFPHLTKSYLIILSQWDNPTGPDFYAFILFIASLLNPVISLNLLISILGNTYDDISSNQVVEDAIELNGMIIEIETLMFWNRNKNSKTFLQVMGEDNLDEEKDGELFEQVSAVANKVINMKSNLNESTKIFNRIKDIIDEKTLEANNSLHELLRG